MGGRSFDQAVRLGGSAPYASSGSCPHRIIGKGDALGEELDTKLATQRACALIAAECEAAIAEDNSGAIVLGCAGMADLAKQIEDRLQVPVIDGVAAAIKFAEALVGLGLRTSKRGDLAYPLRKTYTGLVAGYAPT